MAAITVLDTFDGSSSPLTTGDGWTQALDAWHETGGIARPTTYATDSAISWATAFTEVAGGASTDTQGLKFRVTLGALTPSSELRIYYRATNADDVTSDRYYVKIKKGSLTPRPNVSNDEIELWKLVSGLDTQITANQFDSSSANKYKASSLGDLRNYVLTAGDIITIIACGDQHILTVKATERYGITSGAESEFIHQQYVDSSIGIGAKYIGLWNIGSTHTNSVQEVAAELFVAKYADVTNGLDTNQGSQSHAYQTIPKLIANVDVGEVGFVKGGVYTDHILYHSISPTPNSGTSWEDQIIFTAVWGSTQVIINNAFFILRDTASKNFRYIRWHGMRSQNFGSQQWRIDSQTTGQIPKYIAIQNCIANDCAKSGFFSTPDIPYVHTVGGFEGYYHWMDNLAYNNGASTFDHGFYCNGKGQLFEYNQSYDNFGDGIKNGFATRDTVVDDDCVIRENLVYGGVAGLNIHTSTNHRVYNNISHTNSTGLFMFGSTYDAIIFNNLLYRNADGLLMRASLDPDVNGTNKGGTSTGHVLYHNVFFENTNVGARLDGIPDDIDFQNNIFRSNATNYRNDPSADGSATNITFDYNNEATDTGVVGVNGVLGNPGFIDEVTPDLRLASTSALKDQGTDLSATIPAYSFIWRARPQGTTWDIGADEVVTPTFPATIADAVTVGESAGMAMDAPINQVPGAQTFTTAVQTAFSSNVSVVCATNNLQTVRLTVSRGTLNVTADPGVVIS